MMTPHKIISRSNLLPALLLAITFLFASGISSYGADIYVDDDACPGVGTGTTIDPYCSIATAITNAVNGDDVLVYPGNYAERIIMKTGVDLLKALAEKPVILPSNLSMVKIWDVNDITLDGFVLDASTGSGFTGISIVHLNGTVHNVTISNCEIKGAAAPGDSISRTGIRMNGSMIVNIIDNTIYNLDNGGISTASSASIYDSVITIRGNTIEGNGLAGIQLRGRNFIDTNRVIIGGSGINDGNLIINNGLGINQDGSGIWLRTIDQVSIENNDIQGNLRAGLLLMDSSSVSPHISGNSIHNNGESGINIGGASGLTIGDNNQIYDNGISGITFFVNNNTNLSGNASSYPVLISGNSIYSNTKAGITVLDRVTGTISIDGNDIYQNSRTGIAFYNNCSAIITDNEIYSHTVTAGIFTGDWSGTSNPDRDVTPTNVLFNRSNGPVNLTIKRNKIHDNRAGMRLDHASGTISNNLVYNSEKGGIRYSGDNTAPYAPFGFSWGITELSNNTLTNNGIGGATPMGSGMAYDDINNISGRNFFDPAVRDLTQGARIIENNILAYNVKSGIRDASCNAGRTYNLYYLNNGTEFFIRPQTGGCSNGSGPNKTGNTGELFADPLFVDQVDYILQAGSPAKNSGSDGFDMGAYGGSDPILW